MLRDFFNKLFGKKDAETVVPASNVVISAATQSDVAVKPTAESVPVMAAQKKKRVQKTKSVVETAWPFDEPVAAITSKKSSRKTASEVKKPVTKQKISTPIKKSVRKKSMPPTPTPPAVSPVPARTPAKKTTKSKKNV